MSEDTVKKATKKTAKKAVKKATKKTAKKAAGAKRGAKTGTKVVRKTAEQQKALFNAMKRKNGATMAEIHELGYNGPAIAAIKMAERHGYKTSVVKPKEGGPKRYFVTGEAK